MLIRRPAIWHRISVRRRPALCPAPIYPFTRAPTGGLGDNAKCVIRVCGSTPEVPAHEAIRALNIACWVQIRDAPIDLRLLGKRRRGGTKVGASTRPRSSGLTDGRTRHSDACVAAAQGTGRVSGRYRVCDVQKYLFKGHMGPRPFMPIQGWRGIHAVRSSAP